MKRFVKNSMILVFLLICVLGLIIFLKPKKQEVSKKVVRTQKSIKGKESLPVSYERKASQRGTLKEITYDTKMTDGSGRVVKKKAMVYLPYGHSKSKRYNSFYLMHGYGGSYQTFLGSSLFPRTFKNVLDHMIEQGDVAPMVVVTPGYTQEYDDYYQSVEGMGDELVNDLIPMIEKKYHTYTTREHRAVGGFSMGGCATWYTLKNHLDTFQYYLPMSMPLYYNPDGYVKSESVEAAKKIHDGMLDSSAKNQKFYIFAASGDKDFMSNATKMQLEDLSKYDGFKQTKDNFTNGNVMFYSWKGHKHSFKASYAYLYNGLIRFFRT